METQIFHHITFTLKNPLFYDFYCSKFDFLKLCMNVTILGQKKFHKVFKCSLCCWRRASFLLQPPISKSQRLKDLFSKYLYFLFILKLKTYFFINYSHLMNHHILFPEKLFIFVVLVYCCNQHFYIIHYS